MTVDGIRSLGRALFRLTFNHIDAWGSTFVIASLPLYVHQAFSWRTLLLLIAITVTYWFGFALNDYFDAPFDAQDREKASGNAFVHHPRTSRRLLKLVLPITLPVLYVFSQFGVVGMLVVGLGGFVMWAYSAPPLRFKSRPGLDLLAHSLFVETFPYLTSLILIGAPWTRLDWVILTILFLASLAAQLEQQIRDYDVDSKTDRNFTTTVGRDVASWLLKLVSFVLIAVTIVHIVNGTIPFFIAVFGLIALPAILHRFFRHDEKPRSEKLIVFSSVTALLYAGAFYLFTWLS